MVVLLACDDRLASSKGETLWVADLTASSALDVVAHRPLWRDNICLESAASSTIAQFRNDYSIYVFMNIEKESDITYTQAQSWQ